MKVFKLDLSGKVVWQYEGRLLRRWPHALRLEALFDVAEVPVAGVTLRRGDRFVETYYDNRMYNVFQVFDRQDGGLKGWYCNLSRAAVLARESVSWVDLGLDLWVWPDGRQLVLDREEFERLALEAAERARALSALEELQRRFRTVAGWRPAARGRRRAYMVPPNS